eukprot:1159784-Pelagomonas_calceolata.AAC.12
MIMCCKGGHALGASHCWPVSRVDVMTPVQNWVCTDDEAFNGHVLQGRPCVGGIPLLASVARGCHDTCAVLGVHG